MFRQALIPRLKLEFFVMFLAFLVGRECALCRTESRSYDASRRSKGSWEIKAGVFCTKPHRTFTTSLILSIAPHDLPPLNVSSSDMSWHGGSVLLLSTTSVSSSSSSSSAFPCALPSPSLNENQVANENAKPD